MPLAETTTTILLCLLAAAIIGGGLISIARDADWWVITRGTVRGRVDRWSNPSRGQRH